MRHLTTLATALMLAIGMTLAAAPAAAAEATSTAVATHIAVTLTEMAVQLSVSTVPAGAVVFDITNKGAAEHEFVVLKTTIAEDALPASSDEVGKAAEIGHVDEVDPVLAGSTATLAVTLTPGSYIVLCNKPGHYAAGMHAALTVTTPVTATLKEMSIGLGQSYAVPGAVTFAVTNTGTVMHEFVVLKTDIAEGALPPSTDEPGKAQEIGHVDEIEDIAAGATARLTLTLTPGKYVLICNEPGHYAAGMHASFIVLPALPTGVAAALDTQLAAQGIEDLADQEGHVDVPALLKAPGVVVTDFDRAAIAGGILPRGVRADGSLMY